MNDILRAILVGAGATLVMDFWGVVRRPLLGWPTADYSPVGRWIGHLGHGRWRHSAIAASAPVHGERVLGWTVHYLTGILFAGALVAVCGNAWLDQPTPIPPLLFGGITVALPLLLVQPAMGAGLAARRLPRPGQARLQALVTHLVFGIGLYASALLSRWAFASWS